MGAWISRQFIELTRHIIYAVMILFGLWIWSQLTHGALIRFLGGTVEWQRDTDGSDRPFDRNCEYRWQVDQGLGDYNFGTRAKGPYTFYASVVHPEVIAFFWNGRSFFVNADRKADMAIAEIGNASVWFPAYVEKR